MFSVTYTGMNLRPLCTAMVWPTKSGWMVERRDQVRRTFLSFVWFMTLIFVIRWSSIKGPFFVERAICKLRVLYLLRRLTMKASVRLLLRVLYPRVGWPQGVTG